MCTHAHFMYPCINQATLHTLLLRSWETLSWEWDSNLESVGEKIQGRIFEFFEEIPKLQLFLFCIAFLAILLKHFKNRFLWVYRVVVGIFGVRQYFWLFNFVQISLIHYLFCINNFEVIQDATRKYTFTALIIIIYLLLPFMGIPGCCRVVYC